MLISSKSTYALRTLAYMAKNNGENKYICLSCIACDLNISRKYLESIMTQLAKSGLVDVSKGKCGGYKLNRKPEAYTLYDVLMITEEELKTTSCCCVGSDGTCKEKECCSVLCIYSELHDLINDFFKNKTIKDIID